MATDEKNALVDVARAAKAHYDAISKGISILSSEVWEFRAIHHELGGALEKLPKEI